MKSRSWNGFFDRSTTVYSIFYQKKANFNHYFRLNQNIFSTKNIKHNNNTLFPNKVWDLFKIIIPFNFRLNFFKLFNNLNLNDELVLLFLLLFELIVPQNYFLFVSICDFSYTKSNFDSLCVVNTTARCRIGSFKDFIKDTFKRFHFFFSLIQQQNRWMRGWICGRKRVFFNAVQFLKN